MKYPFSYMPVLKWKLGEQQALQGVSSAARAIIFPLVEVMDRPYDWEDEVYTASWDVHLKKTVASAAKYWGSGHEIAFDTVIDVGDVLETSTKEPWTFLFEEFWKAGVDAVPVISDVASRSERLALMAVSAAHGRERYVLRFAISERSPVEAASWHETVLKEFGGDSTKLDVVLDLGAIEGSISAALISNVVACYQGVAQLGGWRSVTLASGAFPNSLAGVSLGLTPIERKDTRLFRLVKAALAGQAQPLRYADYGIVNPDFVDADPRMMRMSANLRYTDTDDWKVYKARSVLKFGFGQYIDLCKILVMASFFRGNAFSIGDANYHAIATTVGSGPGNATHWRRDGTSHHIAIVLSQLSSLGVA